MELKQLKQNATMYGVPVIRTESHNILENEVIKTKPNHILEIGTAIGYSGITMLKASTADLVTIEHNKDYIKQAKKNFAAHKFSKRVRIEEGDCLVILANMAASGKYNNYFDFVFLDGPKAQYETMLDLIVMMLKPNGTFVADNVLFRGYVEGENKPASRRYKTIIDRLNRFIESCKNHKDLTDFELKNVEDGMIFAKKRTEC
ncbi:MAG: methyltransferase domain-containing protein [Clostridiales bacterium]|nr:methyltransferase domain-containing protein [Clostridiales bacterium]